MGRIKQTYLKVIGEKLIEKHPGEFNEDFDNNKLNVQKFSTVTSKSIRNKIAGYITRLNAQKIAEQKRLEMKAADEAAVFEEEIAEEEAAVETEAVEEAKITTEEKAPGEEPHELK